MVVVCLSKVMKIGARESEGVNWGRPIGASECAITASAALVLGCTFTAGNSPHSPIVGGELGTKLAKANILCARTRFLPKPR